MSKIEWTDITRNITTGCTKISIGCKNCYAEKMHKRLQLMGLEKYKRPFDEVKEHWDMLYILGQKLEKMKKPKKIFINSMSDLYHPEISNGFIKKALQVFSENPQHTFQLLTKRTGRLTAFNYPENVWLGVTIEHYPTIDRMTELLKTNARIKFISCEPLLGDIYPSWWTEYFKTKGINWIIAGGETGPNKRLCEKEWVMNLKNFSERNNIPFFFKQWNSKGKNTIEGKVYQQFPE